MSDLVERLRNRIHDSHMDNEWLMDEAVDEIDRLRAALEEIKQLETLDDNELSTSGEIARKALEPTS